MRCARSGSPTIGSRAISSQHGAPADSPVLRLLSVPELMGLLGQAFERYANPWEDDDE